MTKDIKSKTLNMHLKKAFTVIESIIAMAIIIVMIALVCTAATLGTKAQTKYSYRLLASSAAAEMYSAFSNLYCEKYYGERFYDNTNPDDDKLTSIIQDYSDNIAAGLGLYTFSRISYTNNGTTAYANNLWVSGGKLAYSSTISGSESIATGDSPLIKMDTYTNTGSETIGRRELYVWCEETTDNSNTYYIFYFKYCINTISSESYAVYDDDNDPVYETTYDSDGNEVLTQKYATTYSADTQVTVTAKINLFTGVTDLCTVTAELKSYKNSVYEETFKSIS